MSELRPDVVKANSQQRKAADPSATRLASANAGSGKTRVLVSRVTRLLLEKMAPEKILCLTYTKAAASEMQTRLFQTLGDWSVMDDDALSKVLAEMLGEAETKNVKLRDARELFAKALETPEGLKVQTIHAFCDRVLGRFPLEAGILPGFEPMDDADIVELRTEVQERIFKEAWDQPDSEIGKALSCLAADRTNIGLLPIFRWMAGQAEAIESWKTSGGVERLTQIAGIDPSDTPLSIKEAFWRNSPIADIRAAAQSLLQSPNSNDCDKAKRVLNDLDGGDFSSAFDDYTSIFLTKKGEIKKTVITMKAPDLAQCFFGTTKTETTAEAYRVLEAYNKVKSARCLEQSRAIYVIAQRFQKIYKDMKQARRWLDFNDLISHVRSLLTQTDVSEWVKYKLDGGIEHILVDEAQDTSPMQWDIIDALSESFGAQEVDKPKTFFAVGDEKQSIYSFQGARPEMFITKTQQYVSEPDSAAIQMSMSFRSSPDVLRVVDAVFDDQRARERMFDSEKVPFAGDRVIHSAFRDDRGLVELWPLAPPPEKPEEEMPWDTRPVDAPNKASSREYLAASIAQTLSLIHI